nr:hypothetical protein [Pseudoxanthomonas winnipegensis]
MIEQIASSATKASALYRYRCPARCERRTKRWAKVTPGRVCRIPISAPETNRNSSAAEEYPSIVGVNHSRPS